MDHEKWIFREVYTMEFEALLRKMGYHLPMLYRNVSISCENKGLGAMAAEQCVDCVRHLTSDHYGELGMIVPAHPDNEIRGRQDAPALNAVRCLAEGKAYSQSAPSSGLFCRTRVRAPWELQQAIAA